MGRPAGTPNKRKAHLLAQLRKLYPEYHPIIEMATIALEKDEEGNYKNDINLRAAMHKEIAQYVEPKRKAIEHSGEITTSNASDLSDDQLASIATGSSTGASEKAESEKLTH